MALAGIVVVAGAALSAAPALAQDALVTVGSPLAPFSQNKQNEPALAVDPVTGTLAAGANEEIDFEACNAGADDTCPFTPGVGSAGIYFSTNAGGSWVQPTYTGLTARNCLGVPGDADPDCTPQTGPIGTVPNYAEAGLVSDGDPAVAWGPVRRSGRFSWANGSRLYYAALTSALPGSQPFKGQEAIAVSHTDDVAGAMAGSNAAWSLPVVASKQNGGLFADKEQVWADNAASSGFFGNVYVCYAGFRGANGQGNPGQPLNVDVSRDGGATWTEHQITNAANNPSGRQGFGRSGCTVRTASDGTAYVFDTVFGVNPAGAAPARIEMSRSTDGGATWSKPATIASTYDACAQFEPSIGRCVMDGVGGARDDLAPGPSVDIANGAPSGAGATDRLVMSWVDGRTLNAEKVMFSSSPKGAGQWSTPADAGEAGDRGYYAAPAISPDGQDVYLVYNAWTTPFRFATEGPGNDRQLLGVVRHADVSAGGVGAFSTLHRGASGDARGSSQNNLAAEFLGDYVYAAATNDAGFGVWNDVRNADDCAAVDAYRQDLHDEAIATGQQTAEAEEPRGAGAGDRGRDAGEPDAPAVTQDCADAPRFGNSDIYGGGWADPTP
jgi:hypothetical protein